MRLLASGAYQLIKGIFSCLKWSSDCFWLCFVVMGPAGKSFLMAQLWVKPAQHVQCWRPSDFSWIQIVKKSLCFIREQIWWIPAWNHREQICSENSTEWDWSRIQSWGLQQETSGENQLKQHWKQPWEPREASRSWLPPWPSGFVHFSYFRRGVSFSIMPWLCFLFLLVLTGN